MCGRRARAGLARVSVECKYTVSKLLVALVARRDDAIHIDFSRVPLRLRLFVCQLAISMTNHKAQLGQVSKLAPIWLH